MRTARIKVESGGYYHCMSRVIEKRHILGRVEKEVFRRMMRKVEGFCGVTILTYSVMGNHFHILVYVPEREEITDDELIRRMRILYSKNLVDEYQAELKEARVQGHEAYARHLRNKYLYRMYDVSQFMKTLKQRFSMWYNRNNDRRGTLWEERFKSILVEGTENALLMMASYIDLNAVRTGEVDDPRDYRYCGYGEAVAGSKSARTGLGMVMLSLDSASTVWRQVGHKYRRLLYMRGEKTRAKPGFSYAQIQQVLREGGKLSAAQVLRCKVRYFSDGVVLGSREFVEDVFRHHREQFGLKRITGARPMKYGKWEGLCTMRDLRLGVITLPDGKTSEAIAKS
jgi:REP element-mobilizing transposase RayT